MTDFQALDAHLQSLRKLLTQHQLLTRRDVSALTRRGNPKNQREQALATLALVDSFPQEIDPVTVAQYALSVQALLQAELEGTKAGAAFRLAELEATSQASGITIKQLRQELEQAQASLGTDKEALQVKLHQAQERITSLEEGLWSAANELKEATLRSKIAESRAAWAERTGIVEDREKAISLGLENEVLACELTAASQKVLVAQREVEVLKTALLVAKKEKSRLQEEVASLDERLATAQRFIDDLTNENQEIRKNYNLLQASLVETQASLAETEAARARLASELGDQKWQGVEAIRLARELAAATRQIESFSAQIRSLTNQLASSEIETVLARNTRDQANQDIASLQATLARLQVQHQQEITVLTKKLRGSREFEQRAQQAESAAQTAKRALEKGLAGHNRVLANHEERVQALLQRIKKGEELLTNATQASASEKAAAQKELARLQAQHAALIAEKDQALAQKDQEIARLTRAKDQAEETLAKIPKQRQETTDRIRALQEQHAREVAKLEALAMATLERTVADLTHKLKEAQENADAIKTANSREAEATKRLYKQTMDDLQKQLAAALNAVETERSRREMTEEPDSIEATLEQLFDEGSEELELLPDDDVTLDEDGEDNTQVAPRPKGAPPPLSKEALLSSQVESLKLELAEVKQRAAEEIAAANSARDENARLRQEAVVTAENVAKQWEAYVNQLQQTAKEHDVEVQQQGIEAAAREAALIEQNERQTALLDGDTVAFNLEQVMLPIGQQVKALNQFANDPNNFVPGLATLEGQLDSLEAELPVIGSRIKTAVLKIINSSGKTLEQMAFGIHGVFTDHLPAFGNAVLAEARTHYIKGFTNAS